MLPMCSQISLRCKGCFDWRIRSAISSQILRHPMAMSGMMMGLVASDLWSCNLPTNSGCSMSPVVVVRFSMVITATVRDMAWASVVRTFVATVC